MVEPLCVGVRDERSAIPGRPGRRAPARPGCVGNKTLGSDGTCADVIAGTMDPSGKCPVSTDFCAADGSCEAGGKCSPYRKKGAVCGPSACNGAALDQKQCDGAGACKTEAKSCGTYACDAQQKACKTTCGAKADCADGWECKGKTCEKVPADGGVDGGAGAGGQGGQAGAGGEAHGGPAAAPPAEAQEGGGCGCRVPPASPPSRLPWLAAAGLAAVAARRRRTR